MSVGSISIGEKQLQKIPKENGNSLIAFTDAINIMVRMDFSSKEWHGQ